MNPIRIVEADLEQPAHRQAVLEIMDIYAQGILGEGRSLSQDVMQALIPGLKSHPAALILLAFDGEKPAGFAICFIGFSTFQAKPLINLHDLAVMPDFRGRGIGRMLLNSVCQKGLGTGCCKITLEVEEKNTRARRMYEKEGFHQSIYTEESGRVLFYSKTIEDKKILERRQNERNKS